MNFNHFHLVRSIQVPEFSTYKSEMVPRSRFPGLMLVLHSQLTFSVISPRGHPEARWCRLSINLHFSLDYSWSSNSPLGDISWSVFYSTGWKIIQTSVPSFVRCVLIVEIILVMTQSRIEALHHGISLGAGLTRKGTGQNDLPILYKLRYCRSLPLVYESI